MDLWLEFECGGRLRMSTHPWLHRMSYFEPFLHETTGEWVPVPGGRLVFKELICMLENDVPQDLDMYHATLALADKLCLDQRLTSRFLCYGTCVMLKALQKKCPEWWQGIREEMVWQKDGACDNSILTPLRLDVPMAFFPDVFHKFEEMDLLFKGVMSRPGGVSHGDNIVSFRPLPECVMRILAAYPGTVVLGGGAVLGHVVPAVQPGNDYDLFVVGATQEQANDITDRISEYALRVKFKSPLAVTMDMQGGVTVQVIRRLYANAGQVAVGFDIAPCKILAWVGTDGGLAIAATPTWFSSVRRLAFPVCPWAWSTSSISRIFKYINKGFDVILPGCNVAKAGEDAPRGSMADMLLVRDAVIANRPPHMRSMRLQQEEYLALVKCFDAGDYDTWPPREDDGEPWAVCDPTRRCMATFHTVDPHTELVWRVL